MCQQSGYAMELVREDMTGSGKGTADDAGEADHDDTLFVDVLHEQVTFFGKKNTSVCVADDENAEMDTDFVGSVVQSLQYCNEDMTGDNILEAVRYLYECRCNQCIAEMFGEDAPVDGLFLCTLSDDLSSPASCNFDFVESHLHLAAGIEIMSLSCDTDAMKQKTFAEVVRGDASELDAAMTPAVWKFSLVDCEVTRQRITAVSEDTEEQTSGDESTDSEEIKLDEIESQLPTMNRVSVSGTAEHSCCDDGTGQGNLSEDTSGLLLHSSTDGNDDSLVEFYKTSNDAVDIGCVRDADESFTEPRLLADTYENRSGVVMVTEQLQTCGVAAKVSVSVQCSPDQVSFGCQVDLYDSDTSDDVATSSSYDDESGIDGDTECDVGEDCARFTRGGENAHRTHVERREISGPLSVVVHNIEADTNTSDDDEKETSLGVDFDSHHGVVCDSSSTDSDEDGHETSESDDNDDVFKAATSESETYEENSGVD